MRDSRGQSLYHLNPIISGRIRPKPASRGRRSVPHSGSHDLPGTGLPWARGTQCSIRRRMPSKGPLNPVKYRHVKAPEFSRAARAGLGVAPGRRSRRKRDIKRAGAAGSRRRAEGRDRLAGWAGSRTVPLPPSAAFLPDSQAAKSPACGALSHPVVAATSAAQPAARPPPADSRYQSGRPPRPRSH